MAFERPNILMIICHDLGQYCGCYGYKSPTPNIDALARRGVTFTNYHCTAAQCSPSRGSIMTGRYPHRNGLVGLAHIGWELNEGEKTLPMYLREAGYRSFLFGLQHETGKYDPCKKLGYDEWVFRNAKALNVAPQVAEFLKSGPPQPFFINVGTFEPHRPYEAEGYQGDDPAEVEILPWLPDRPGIRQDIADLNGLVRALDQAVGIIMDALEQSGLAEETIVLFTTDHGLAMPRAKGTCYDPGTKTALVMSWAGNWPAGVARDELLVNCDLLPTLLEAVGMQPPEPPQIDGRSFLGLINGRPYQPRDHIFLEMTWHDKYNPMRAIRTNRWKYIRNFGERPLVYLPKDIWTGRAGREMREEYYSAKRPEEELYDLQADPWEMNNLAGDPRYAEILEDLRQRVQRWMEETGDRLLEGDWPPTPEQVKRLEEETEPN